MLISIQGTRKVTEADDEKLSVEIDDKRKESTDGDEDSEEKQNVDLEEKEGNPDLTKTKKEKVTK